MKTFPIFLILTIILSYNFLCSNAIAEIPETAANSREIRSDSLFQRFPAPPNFRRAAAAPNSFAAHLRRLPLKPAGSPVLLYNGAQKGNQNAHVAVVDLPIGRRDLHQCADAVMRLRADYLRQTKQADRIHFNLTNGFRVDYSRWRKGGRVKVSGNKTEWVQTAAASNSDADYWKYLELVFSYAGTLSLSRELKPVPLSDLQIGDVFIRGGSPGHAVIVVDVASDAAGQKMFLLAQSYMPAQEIQILRNPAAQGDSPWYAVADIGEDLETPEWNFKATDLKRFEE